MAHGNMNTDRYQGYQAKMHTKAIAANADIAMPEKIRCYGCNKVKPSTSYSAKRQEDLKKEIRSAMSARRSFDAVKEPLVTCSMCTAGQITELECSGCDKWMGLDNFAKAQRRKPDQALCWKCSEDRQNMLPITEDCDDDSYSSDGSGGTDDSYDSNTNTDVNSITTGMSQASISNTTDASTGYPRGGGVSLSTTASSAKGTIFGGSAAGSHMSSSIGGTPSSRQSISSTAGAASVASSSAASTTSTHRPGNFYKKSYGTSGHPSPTGSTTTNNREFAKVSSGPKKVESDMARLQRERESSDGETRVSSEDDSD